MTLWIVFISCWSECIVHASLNCECFPLWTKEPNIHWYWQRIAFGCDACFLKESWRQGAFVWHLSKNKKSTAFLQNKALTPSLILFTQHVKGSTNDGCNAALLFESTHWNCATQPSVQPIPTTEGEGWQLKKKQKKRLANSVTLIPA